MNPTIFASSLWFSEPIILPDSPFGYLGSREASLFYYLARSWYSGLGVIVDAGSFLGRSTVHFGEGLRLNVLVSDKSKRIHCFDDFLIHENEEDTSNFIQNNWSLTTSVGSSFREIFDAQTKRISEFIETHHSDFNSCVLPSQPIEILMVDIAKD